MRNAICGAAMAGTLLSSPGLCAAEAIGQVHRVQGTATIVRNGAAQPATVGTAVFSDDHVRTGKPGAIGVVLTDDTTISLGSDSELDLGDYAFDPAASRFTQVVRMLKGTFSYISGQIGRLSPESVRLQTPDATIAVRGTKLLVEVSP